jgi:hypothetical protein
VFILHSRLPGTNTELQNEVTITLIRDINGKSVVRNYSALSLLLKYFGLYILLL